MSGKTDFFNSEESIAFLKSKGLEVKMALTAIRLYDNKFKQLYAKWFWITEEEAQQVIAENAATIEKCEGILKTIDVKLVVLTGKTLAQIQSEDLSYNEEPEGLKELKLEDWQRGFFTYCLKPVESRQVRGSGNYDLRMFDIPNFDNKKLGYAIKVERVRNNTSGTKKFEDVTTFCRYGKDEDWVSFEQRFAAQFKGDHS